MKTNLNFSINFISILLACTVISSCFDKNNRLESISKIKKIQSLSATSSQDSTYFLLKQSESLLSKLEPIQDSLLVENNFLIGKYFHDQDQIDSSAIYFYKTVDILNQEISNGRQRNYFYMAWRAAFNNKKYGECIVIANKFKSLISESTDYDSLALYYFFCEYVFIETKDYDLALDNNQLRIQAVRRTKDTINIVSAKMARAQIRFHYFSDLNGAFEIMDELVNQIDNLPYEYRKSVYGEYGVYMFYDEQYEQALNFYLKGLENLRKSKDRIRTKTNFAIAYGNIAEAYLELGKYQDAQKYIDSVYTIGFNNIDRNMQNMILKYQLRVSSLTNSEPKIVLQSLDSIFKYMDLQYEEKFNGELKELKIAKANEKHLLKTSEKYKLKNRTIKYIVYLLLVTLFVLSLIVWLIYSNVKIKSKLRQWMLLDIKEKNLSQQKTTEIEKYLSISVDVINKIREQLENFEHNKEFLSEKIQLRQLAKKFNTNYTYLSKVINMDKGKNFSQYINDLRLDFAFKEMVNNPIYKRYTIKAIAQQCGFKSAGNFSRKFHIKYGQYPSNVLKL